MKFMFDNCCSLKELDLSSFNTTKVNDMSSMFCNCSSLISLDLSSFNTSHVNEMNRIFKGCFSLKKEKVKVNDEKILCELEKSC